MMAAAVVGHAQTQLRVFTGGKAVGNVVYSQKVTDDGQKIIDSRMVWGTGPSAVTTVITTTVDALGTPVRKIQDMLLGSLRTKTLVDFTATGARVVTESRGERKVQNFPAPTGVSTTDPTQYWFLRDRPSPGTKVKYADFNVSSLKWETVEATYVGKKSVVIGELTMKGYELSVKRGKEIATVVVDANNIPITFSDGGPMRLERVQ